ncbi:3-oxoacyl-ACP synthase II [Luteitalea sp. TBR-22]|nr:3-oxoacyl-ACP synthase II [Luteitalea sp. TBR-22]
MKRVVVTGVGAICALGHTASDTWQALAAGRSGAGPLDVPERETVRIANAAQVRGFDTAAHFDGKAVELLDRFAQFGLVAGREAVRDARVTWDAALRSRTAIVTGSAAGGQASIERVFEDLWRQGRSRVPVLTIPRFMPSAVASHLAMAFGVTGPTFTCSTACASANHAIGQAFWMVRTGQVDMAIAGGSEAPFSLGHLKAWEAMRVVARDTCRPFSLGRDGMILGEGGAMLVLEPADAALARGAPIHAELAGFGMSADAHHITQPHPEGAARAITAALQDAGVAPAAVGYVNAHGTGTTANDAMEAAAIRLAFGPHADRLAVSSTKSMHGHALGAAGALEAVATVLALRHGLLPPTANYVGRDPECDLDVIPNEPRHTQAEVALSNSFAFGGLNAVLAFRRWDGSAA